MFRHGDLELHYSQRGRDDAPPVVLLHGLLWSSRLQERLSVRLADEHRMLLLDLRGHGKSQRPTDPDAYSWLDFADDVTALLDHLGLEQAVVGGTSLGANVTLGMAFRAPERLAGMVLEMPVLSRGHDVGRPVFGALARSLERLAPLLQVSSAVVSRVPLSRRVPDLVAVRDVLAVEPRSAAAMLRGLLDDVTLPEGPEIVGTISIPALVVGHRFDRLHSFDDATDLAGWLPNADLVQARNIAEFRALPGRLADHLRDFLASVYGPPTSRPRRAPEPEPAPPEPAEPAGPASS